MKEERDYYFYPGNNTSYPGNNTSRTLVSFILFFDGEDVYLET